MMNKVGYSQGKLLDVYRFCIQIQVESLIIFPDWLIDCGAIESKCWRRGSLTIRIWSYLEPQNNPWKRRFVCRPCIIETFPQPANRWTKIMLWMMILNYQTKTPNCGFQDSNISLYRKNAYQQQQKRSTFREGSWLMTHERLQLGKGWLYRYWEINVFG